MGKVWIGTSGWHYGHWKDRFYPEKLPASQYLAYYAEHFDTVEINNSFYKLPARETFVVWRKSVPADFMFAVKASRFITHMKKLKDSKDSFKKFFKAVSGLGDKLGPILFQLPPRWRVNSERLAEFLATLPGTLEYTFEFRETGWFSEEVLDLLSQHGCSLCFYDLAGYESPLVFTGDPVYIRLHGPTEQKYAGSYSAQKLGVWKNRIDKWRKKSEVYLYFDNDQKAFAIKNALTMREKFRRTVKGRRAA